MLKDYRDVPNIKNQFGVYIPVFMIHMEGDTRESAIQSMNEKGYKDIYAPEHLQEFVDYVFDFHKVEFGEEHEANLCEDDNDVWKMFMKNKYNHIKKIVHRKEEMAIDIFDEPNTYRYIGVKIKPSYENGELDTECSEITLYHVDPYCHDGMENESLSFDDLKVIMDKINLVPKNKK